MPINTLSSCVLEVTWRSAERNIMLEVTWRSAERNIKSVLEVTWRNAERVRRTVHITLIPPPPPPHTIDRARARAKK